ncbi:unnamed protein product [Blepharisma stoltei]|uniref:TmcB/TmcC TPR repeats domain-containing protein n=1 Tax=Blepharisma stoltei TaxID=1481888 RepID=A0AAU9J6W8_9CILI|nr:unnamed protein product [Blepharisma stoltei]
MLGTKVEMAKDQVLGNVFLKTQSRISLIKSLFEVYRRLFFCKTYREKSFLTQKIKAVIEAIILCLQLVTFLWVPNLSIKNWSGNMLIWEIIGYTRIDIACSSENIIAECLEISISLVFVNFTGIIVFTSLIYYYINIPTVVISLFQKVFYLWKLLFSIPSMTLFAIFLKYNFLAKSHISEYKNNNDFTNFKINSTFQISIILAMVISFFLVLFYTELSGEIRHSVANKTIEAKAHSKIDIHIALFSYFSPILYAIFAENSIIYLQILAIISSIILVRNTLNYTPYFSHFYNTMIIIQFLVIGLISFIFVLGNWLNNSLSIILLALVVVPLLGILAIQFIYKSWRKSVPSILHQLIDINSDYELEKRARDLLCSNNLENKDQIIHIFENFFIEKSLNGSKLQAIWVANYCLYALEDNSLARIKLSKIKKIQDWGLETNYQAYLCEKNTQELYTSEVTNFLEYFTQFEKIKKKDHKLCVNLLEFWKEIISEKPSLNKLVKNLNKIDEYIAFLNNEYIQITGKFPNSRESLALYASYTRNILYDIENSTKIDNKLRYFDRVYQNYIYEAKDFSLFNDINGIFIVSYEEESFGTIIFANKKASEILKTPLNFLVGNNLANLYISHYKEELENEFKVWLQFNSNPNIDLKEGFFLNLPSSFILELVGKSSLTSINHSIVSILTFKPKQAKHEIAILTENFEISSYTENFGKFTKNKGDSLVGIPLQTLFNDLENIDLKASVPYNISGFEIETILVLSYFEFSNSRIPYASLTNDPQEILELKLGKSGPKFYDEIQTYEFDSKAPHQAQTNNLEISEIEESHLSEEKSQVSHISSMRMFSSVVKSSSRSINILHGVFVLSVLVVIVANIAVLFYTFSSVDLVSNIDLPLTIGNMGNYMQATGYLSRAMLVLNQFGGATTESLVLLIFSIFKRLVSRLEDDYLYISSNLTNWNYCSGRSIFVDENTYLWEIDSDFYMRKTNLLNGLFKIIQIVKIYIGK